MISIWMRKISLGNENYYVIYIEKQITRGEKSLLFSLSFWFQVLWNLQLFPIIYSHIGYHIQAKMLITIPSLRGSNSQKEKRSVSSQGDLGK